MLSVLFSDEPRAWWSCYGEPEVVNNHAVNKPSAVSRDSSLMRRHSDPDAFSPVKYKDEQECGLDLYCLILSCLLLYQLHSQCPRWLE